MILVSVGQSWTASHSREEADGAISGDWPTRAGVTREDIEANADVLLALKRGRIVAARTITNVVPTQGGRRVQFELADPPPDVAALVGQRAPQAALWRRGEAWPIKVADTSAALAAMPTTLPMTEASQPVALGVFRVQVIEGRHLIVDAPAQATIEVRTRR